MDKVTATGKHLAYARCCMEIAAYQLLPTKVCLEEEEGEREELEVE